MAYRLTRLFVALLLALGMALPLGCASSGQSDSAAAEPEIEVNPQVGMTKEEIKVMYQGDPDSKTVSSDGGETWRYHMNAGAAWIPYNFGYRPEYDVLHFDKEGKLVSFERTQ